MQSGMKLPPWNLTKAQLPAPGVPAYSRPSHTNLLCPCLLHTYQELRSGETSFLPCRTQPGRRWFYCFVSQGQFLSSPLVRNTEAGVAAAQLCPELPPSHPHLTPVVPAVRSQSNNDCVGSVYENMHILWLVFLHPSPVWAVRWWNAKQRPPATAVSPPPGGRMTPSRGHCVCPGAQGPLRLHRSSTEKLRGNASAVRWAQRQLPGYTSYPHNYLMPFKAKSPSHCPSHSPISLHKQAPELEAGKKNKWRTACLIYAN